MSTNVVQAHVLTVASVPTWSIATRVLVQMFTLDAPAIDVSVIIKIFMKLFCVECIV